MHTNRNGNNPTNRTTFINNNLNCLGEEIRDVLPITILTENYLMYNTSDGEIRWTNKSFLRNLSINSNSGIGINNNLYISNDIISINTSAFIGRINSDVNITLNNINYSDITQIQK